MAASLWDMLCLRWCHSTRWRCHSDLWTGVPSSRLCRWERSREHGRLPCCYRGFLYPGSNWNFWMLGISQFWGKKGNEGAFHHPAKPGTSHVFTRETSSASHPAALFREEIWAENQKPHPPHCRVRLTSLRFLFLLHHKDRSIIAFTQPAWKPYGKPQMQENTGRSQQRQLQVNRACVFYPPSSKKEALSNRVIARRGAGGSELACKSAALNQGAEKSLLLVTATPTTSAHPLIPQHTQALAGCDRKGCTNRHFSKEDM